LIVRSVSYRRILDMSSVDLMICWGVSILVYTMKVK